MSLFSPAHQLAVLEVREKQGVSLLERSTSLTAESLDQPLGMAALERSHSLPAEPALDAVERGRERGSSITADLLLGPDGVLPLHVSPKASSRRPRPQHTASRRPSQVTNASQSISITCQK